MPDTIFWDTAAFVALGNADDNLHLAAVAISQELAQSQAHVITTDAVLTEVANVFSKMNWRPIAHHLIDAIQKSASMQAATIVHISPSLWQQGWQLFIQRPDKDWGLTDCLSFVVMRNYKVLQAFTSDHHFEQAGFSRLLK